MISGLVLVYLVPKRDLFMRGIVTLLALEKGVGFFYIFQMIFLVLKEYLYNFCNKPS
jgi:hypothetical protein